jgi:hypothetical protein
LQSIECEHDSSNYLKMAEFSINGDIFDTSLDRIRSCVSEALNLNDLNPLKMDIYLERDNYDLYIFSYQYTSPGNEWFLVDFTYRGSFHEAIEFLKQIAIVLYRNNIVFNFELVTEDEIDYVVKHPDWRGCYGTLIDFLDDRLNVT